MGFRLPGQHGNFKICRFPRHCWRAFGFLHFLGSAMPIYAYKCASCGYAKDALQKMSDPPLTVCPRCGEAALQKQVTAAGFQLKGSGWYVTDFRGGGASADKEGKKGEAESGAGAAKNDAKLEGKPASASESKSGGTTPAASTPTSSGGGAD
jgi:putative FmdB family regulatory protein